MEYERLLTTLKAFPGHLWHYKQSRAGLNYKRKEVDMRDQTMIRPLSHAFMH
jgi:hypothetical protein